MTRLAQSIYKTLVFFDAQDMPLTLAEISSYLVADPEISQMPTFRQIEKTILLELTSRVNSNHGFYFLSGREFLIPGRQKKYRTSLQNFRKAKKYLSFLRFFPYLRAVAISGSEALLNSSDSSDIDLFVLTKKNRIWLTRLLVSAYFQILGERRYSNRIRGRFCLNHYVCEGQILRADQNLYTAVEYASLVPVLGRGALEKFWRENGWIRDFLAEPQYWPTNTFFGFQFSRLQKVFEFLLDFTLGPILNSLSGLYQKRRIKMQEYILVSDAELSFHPGSRGQKVLRRFAAKLELIDT